MDYEQLKKANATIEMTDIKGNKYAEVHQRIKAFRMCYPEGAIKTEMMSDKDGRCIFMATVYAEYPDKVLGTGTAYESEASSYINKTSYIENCETSAVGRALGMCGFGIDGAVASLDEAKQARDASYSNLYMDDLRLYAPKCEDCGEPIMPIYRRDGTPWHLKELLAFSETRFNRQLCPACQKKAIKTEKEAGA